MGYLLFNADQKEFDDGDGNTVSLGAHLSYLNDFGGTPDFWDAVDTDSRSKAVAVARETGMHLYVVEESSYRVVGVVNKPEQNV